MSEANKHTLVHAKSARRAVVGGWPGWCHDGERVTTVEYTTGGRDATPQANPVIYERSKRELE